MFVMSLFPLPRIAPFGIERTWETNCTFLNSFQENIKQLMQRLERINDRRGRYEEFILFNQTFKRENSSYIYIYIYKENSSLYIYIYIRKILPYIYIYKENSSLHIYIYKFFLINIYIRKILPIYIYIYKETQTWLNCHYKFISAKNIIILFVSSDDFTRLI